MKLASAKEAIQAILAAVPDDELPSPERTEEHDGKTVAWFGGHGYHLGTAQRRKGGGEWVRSPESYRDNAISEAVQLEAVYRLDLKHLEGETA